MNRIVKLMCKYSFLVCFVLSCLFAPGCVEGIRNVRLVVENDSLYEFTVPIISFITVCAFSEKHFGLTCESIVYNKNETKFYYQKIILRKNEEGQSPFLSKSEAFFLNDSLKAPNRFLVRFALPQECESVTVLFHVHMRLFDYDQFSIKIIR